jgi:hypothetical protein
MDRLTWISSLFLCALFLSALPPAYAARATDAEMALSALQAAVRTSDASVIGNAISQSRMSLQSRARIASAQRKIAPEPSAAATVIFSHGLTADEVQTFANRYRLEVAGAEAKVATDDQGRVMTMAVGASDLLRRNGTLADRLRIASGSQQFTLMRNAEHAPADDANRLLEAAHTRLLKYYRVQAIGSVTGMELMTKDKNVSAVLADENDAAVTEFQARKAYYAEMLKNSPPPIIRRFKDGPPPGVSLDQLRSAH